jgi:NAD(P)-dependent dehydrogenase (short-subunit alcohol dehydrogenase family)
MTDPDDYKGFAKSVQINLAGTYKLSKLLVDKMSAQNQGSIINIGSIMGVVGPTNANYEGLKMQSPVAYHTEKAGLIGMTRWLAATYGKYNIRCNTISAGGFLADQDPVFIERYNKCTFLGRMVKEDDVKGLIVFLASDASSYITGENIMLDGGYVQK